MALGVFVCTCGGRMEIDQATLENMLSDQGIGVFLPIDSACSLHGIKKIASIAREKNLDKILVGACKPIETWALAGSVLERHGINPGRILVVDTAMDWERSGNNPVEAAKLVARTIRANIPVLKKRKELGKRKVRAHESVVVVGGGIAGMLSALDLARQGRNVVIIDKTPTLGGRALDPEWDVLTPLEARHKATELATLVQLDDRTRFIPGSTLRGFRGGPGRYQLLIEKKPIFINWEACDDCGACILSCPKGFICYYHENAQPHKPIIRGDPEYCRNSCEKPCIDSCPRDAIRIDEEREHLVLEAGALVVATGLVFDEKTRDGTPTIWALSRKIGTKPDSPEGSVLALIVPSRDVLGEHEGLVWRAVQRIGIAWLDTRDSPRVFVFSPGDPSGDETIKSFLSDKRVSLVRALPSRVDTNKKEVVVSTSNGVLPLGFDEVAVATPPRIEKETRELLTLFGVPCRRDTAPSNIGGQIENAPGLGSPPVFSCGSLAGQGTIHETMEGARACAHASAWPTRGEVTILDTTPEIDPAACSGCGACVWACPIKAIAIDKKEGIARINSDACNNCGACVSSCPSGAIRDPIHPVDGVVEGLKTLARAERGSNILFVNQELAEGARSLFSGIAENDTIVFTVPSPLYPGVFMVHQALPRGTGRVFVSWWPPDPKTRDRARVAATRASMYNEILSFMGVEEGRLVAEPATPRDLAAKISRRASTGKGGERIENRKE